MPNHQCPIPNALGSSWQNGHWTLDIGHSLVIASLDIGHSLYDRVRRTGKLPIEPWSFTGHCVIGHWSFSLRSGSAKLENCPSNLGHSLVIAPIGHGSFFRPFLPNGVFHALLSAQLLLVSVVL